MLILINGSINSGKSTIAKLLAKSLKDAVVFELDDIRDEIPDVPIDKAIPTVHKRAIQKLATEYKNNLVIIPYPLSRMSYNNFYIQIKDIHKDIYAFTLSPSKKIAQSNRGGRRLNDWERKRIDYHYSININNPGYGKVINNSSQSPEETAGEILKSLK
jgi:hypothetical protein